MQIDRKSKATEALLLVYALSLYILSPANEFVKIKFNRRIDAQPYTNQ